MRPRTGRLSFIAVAVTVLFAVSGCTAVAQEPESEPGEVRLTNAVPAVSVIGSDFAIKTSKAIFTQTPIVVVAPEDDAASLSVGAEAAITLGVPLLTTRPAQPASTPAAEPVSEEAVHADPVSDEIERLGATRILAVGTVPDLTVGNADRLDIEATPAALAEALGGPASVAHPADVGGIARYVAPSNPELGMGTLGAVPARAPAAAVTAVVTATPDTFAAAASARAAGARIVVKAAPGDILADGDVITALAEGPAESTILIGTDATGQPDPDWSVRAARTGYQLPGGGQRLFGDHRFVAVYGTPATPVLGILGEQGATDTIARASALAGDYTPLSDVPVVPTLEIIATVAAGEAGGDGNYSNELDPASLSEFVDAAAASGTSVVLDLQPGRTDFLTQAKQYQSLLERPNVGLALDPEWRLAPDQVPLEQIGTVTASEVNDVSAWLAALVDAKSLPPKMLVLHEFRTSMISDRDDLATDIPQLEFLVHVDGQGAQPDKQATYTAMLASPPHGVAAGWKNFIDEDAPMLSPEQTMTVVSAVPDFISYQ